MAEFQIRPVDRKEAGLWDHASFAPDGSAMVWRPNEQQRSR